MTLQHFNTLPSTYTYMVENARGMASDTVILADYQSAGRGQRGNTWESEAGKNMLFSMLVRMPGFQARNQFYISEAVSLAIVDVLLEYANIQACIKWPNDIYVDDLKIAGILISHSLQTSERGEAEIAHTIIGIGLNLNQTEFRGTAPNPISVISLTGKQLDSEQMARAVGQAIRRRLDAVERGEHETMHKEYMSKLWRGDGEPHPFYDVQTGGLFDATVYAIEPMGHLLLQCTDGTLRRYAFKEVSWR